MIQQTMPTGIIKYHSNLSDYYKSQILFFDGDLQKKPNIRKLVELPWQQTKLAMLETKTDMWDPVIETLCDLFFIEAKCIAGMTFKLIDDYRNALSYISDNQSKLSTEKENKKKIEDWIQKIIRYSEKWNERRDMSREGRPIIESEPVFPEPPSCCRLKLKTKESLIPRHDLINYMNFLIL
jgi:hypothetical protein